MNKLHIYTICIWAIYFIGHTVAAPVPESSENQPRELATISDDSPGPTLTSTNDAIPGSASTGDENRSRPREFILEIVETKDAAQTKDVLVVDEIVAVPIYDDDMEVAETHIFRPLFRYRAQLERRRKLSQSQS